MNGDQIFPDVFDSSTSEEPWDHRFKPLADILECEVWQVQDTIGGAYTPEHLSKIHLDAVQKQAGLLTKAINPTKKLINVLHALPEEALTELRRRGVVTVEQIEHLLDVVTGRAERLHDWYSRYPRPGGRNVAAHTIAEGVRVAFRRHRKPITYGVDKGAPTTDFCRAVMATIAAFGERADWSEPARGAWEKQQNIQMRLDVLKANQKRRRELLEKCPFLDRKSISIRFQGIGVPANVVALIDNTDPAAKPLLVPIRAMRSGDKHTIEHARAWANSRK